MPITNENRTPKTLIVKSGTNINNQPINRHRSNGALTTSDIQNDIDAETYCADLTVDCVELIISEEPTPVFSGPIDVCSDVEVVYSIDNFTGDTDDYLLSINQGSFSQFIDNSSKRNDHITSLYITTLFSYLFFLRLIMHFDFCYYSTTNFFCCIQFTG